MEAILVLLLISFPLFYIYGIICFLRNFGKHDTNVRKNDEGELDVLKTLRKKAEAVPDMTITQFLLEYVGKKEANETVVMGDDKPAMVRRDERVDRPEEPQESFFASWYSTNSINLLLYIGAFFIVAAAAIFVGFQWETISGVAKAVLLTLVAVGFFSFGYWFYGVPKIKHAGNTFIAIAAVLIPVCGAAWYNFVLRDAGVPMGVAWLLTSFLALTAYLYLALFLKNTFYSYASTVSTFSLLLSLVNSFSLAKDFYVLAGIIACFLLFLFSRTLQAQKSALSDSLMLPSELSSEIAMPVTLVYGFMMAIGEGKLFSQAGVLSAFTATLFYYLGYRLSRKTWKFAVAEILFLGSMYLSSHYLLLPDAVQYYVVAISAVSLAVHAHYYKQDKREEESDISLTISMIAAILVFVVAWTTDIAAIPLTLLTLAPILIAVIAVILKKTHYPLFIASGFLAMLVYLLYMQVFGYEQFPEYLGLLYLLFAIGKYGITVVHDKRKDIREVGFISTAVYAGLSLVFSYSNQPIFIICALGIAGLFFASSVLYKVQAVNYGGLAFLVLGLITFLDYSHAPYANYPLVFTIFVTGIFILSRLVPSHMQPEFRNASLALAVITNAFFFLSTRLDLSEQGPMERNALLGAYATTILFSIDYSITKVRAFGYVTSVIALCTLLWQILFLGYTNTLLFTTPVGIYFMGIAYTRKLFHDPESEELFNLVSAGFLLVPPFLLSFGDNAVLYSVILGLEAILLVLFGIAIARKVFRYAGVAGIVLAILPQTYNYVLALPRWVLVGILGVAFLAVAIFLLLKRKEDK